MTTRLSLRTPRLAAQIIALSLLVFLPTQSIADEFGERPIVNHSHATPNVVVRHMDFDLRVDFDGQRLSGSVTLEIENPTGARELVLDSRGLVIHGVHLGVQDPYAASFKVEEGREPFGSPLVITIKPNTKHVTVQYETGENAAALQWVPPEQTEGGTKPFFYTLSFAILGRTWMPCQDHPGNRVTYNATIHVPQSLMAVMSAENPQEKRADGIYRFRMKQPIPTYLITLAVGDLEFRSLGDRTGVYAEPGMIEAAAAEFGVVQKMMDLFEGTFADYRWDRYDLLITPRSFPYMGMENPRLPFHNPIVIAGDGSLSYMAAHELAHSWSGNLVTNGTWSDFWLNEGFTVWFHRWYMEKALGKRMVEMQAIGALASLKENLSNPAIPDGLKSLRMNVGAIDPDNAVTHVPYEKGYFFLRMIEERVGRTAWLGFLRKYIEEFAFQSITTEDFLDLLEKELIKGDERLRESLQLDAWLNQPGLPANMPKLDQTVYARADQEIAAYLKHRNAAKLNTQGWVPDEWIRFFRGIREEVTAEDLAALDKRFSLSKAGNSELLGAWLRLTVQKAYRGGYPALHGFLSKVGYWRLSGPLYQELVKSPEGRQMAEEIFEKARHIYHSSSVGRIEKILYPKKEGLHQKNRDFHSQVLDLSNPKTQASALARWARANGLSSVPKDMILLGQRTRKGWVSEKHPVALLYPIADGQYFYADIKPVETESGEGVWKTTRIAPVGSISEATYLFNNVLESQPPTQRRSTAIFFGGHPGTALVIQFRAAQNAFLVEYAPENTVVAAETLPEAFQRLVELGAKKAGGVAHFLWPRIRVESEKLLPLNVLFSPAHLPTVLTPHTKVTPRFTKTVRALLPEKYRGLSEKKLTDPRVRLEIMRTLMRSRSPRR